MRKILLVLFAITVAWNFPVSAAERAKGLYGFIDENEKLLPKNTFRVRPWRLGKNEQQRIWQGNKPRLIDICVKSGSVLIIPKIVTTTYTSAKDNTTGLVIKDHSCYSVTALAVTISTKNSSTKTDATGNYVIYGPLKSR